jgi:hypothetical protein
MPWVLASRGRQKMCQAVIDACTETDMTTPAYLFVDARVDEYAGLEAPENWKVIRIDTEHHVWDCFNLVYQLEPHAEWYGLLTDDIKPITPNWDTTLIQLVKPFYLVDCHDGWLANDPMIALYSLCGNCFVWGGDLVRAVGWWGVPGIHSGVGQDDAWVHLICKKLADLRLRRLVKTVLVEHHQYKNDKRAFDESDSHTRDGINFYERDWALFEKWKQNDEEVMKIADRVRKMVEDYRKHEVYSFIFDTNKLLIYKDTTL